MAEKAKSCISVCLYASSKKALTAYIKEQGEDPADYRFVHQTTRWRAVKIAWITC